MTSLRIPYAPPSNITLRLITPDHTPVDPLYYAITQIAPTHTDNLCLVCNRPTRNRPYYCCARCAEEDSRED